MIRVLLLAGTADARDLAERLTAHPGLDVTASLAGVTETPAAYPVPVRTGGFGGVHGLSTWLNEHRPGAVIDATHPYAAQMQANAVAACNVAGIPRLRLLRPEWPMRAGWVHVPDLAAAAQALPSGAKALLTTGRKEVSPFAARPDVQLVLRSIEPVENLPDHIQPMIARPPFTVDQERATFALLGITHLVTKNAGGPVSAKLDAAEDMRLTTIVVDRPAPPPGPIAETPEQAVAWLRRTVAF